MLLLQDCYEKFREEIEHIAKLSTASEHTNIRRSGNVQGVGSYSYSTSVNDYELSIHNVDGFSIQMTSFNSDSHLTRNTFYEDEYWSEVFLGKDYIGSEFIVQKRSETEDIFLMQYPILEEEYFQNSTVIHLAPEEFYEYFMGIDRIAPILKISILTHHDTGMTLLRSFLESPNLVHTIRQNLCMLMFKDFK